MWVKTLIGGLFYMVSSVGLFFLTVYVLADLCHFKDPKTAIIEGRLDEWNSKLEYVNVRFEKLSARLEDMENRDNLIYRSIFGMEPVSKDIRDAGYGGVDRYDYLKLADHTGRLTKTVRKSDVLLKKAYVQSNSFDDVYKASKKINEMVVCVPSIPPVDYTHVYKSSNFGMRLDPITKKRVRPHNGVDLAPYNRKDGEPVYVTGNGVVTKVGFERRGFGNYVEVTHGF